MVFKLNDFGPFPCDLPMGKKFNLQLDVLRTSSMTQLGSETHSRTTLLHWKQFVLATNHLSKETAIDGHSLNVATVVAVARFVANIELERYILFI